MQWTHTQQSRNFLLISILCHLLCFLTMIGLTFFYKPQSQKAPEINISSYVYQTRPSNASNPMYAGRQAQRQKLRREVQSKNDAQPIQSIQDSILKAKPQQQNTMKQSLDMPLPLANMVNSPPLFSTPQQYKTFVEESKNKEKDAVHMLGEKMIEDPLRKLIGIALTKHLVYPEIAGRLGIRGVVTLSMLLAPEGTISEVRLIKSSHEKMLDVAAINAIQESSPIPNIDIYLHEPKRLLINIIFH